MRISHNDAIRLETIVRSVYGCDRAGMGGYIDADHFEGQPFDAALISLAPLWIKSDLQEMKGFLYKWEYVLRSNTDVQSVDIDAYVNELDDLVSILKER